MASLRSSLSIMKLVQRQAAVCHRGIRAAVRAHTHTRARTHTRSGTTSHAWESADARGIAAIAAAAERSWFPAAATALAAGGVCLSLLSDSEPACASVPDSHGFASTRYASLPDMIEDVFPGLCKIHGFVGDRKLGGGSGFIIDEAGHVVTNDHVFAAMIGAGAREIQAQFDDGRTYRIEPIASDEEADIAIGRIIAPPGTRFKPMRIGDSAKLRRGEGVCVLGAPLGGSLVPTAGVLSGIRYVADDDVMNYVLNSRSDWCLLQVDANMSSGSSGGPIVNYNGEVIGVSVMVQTAAYGVGNVNFGVAIHQAWPIIQALKEHGSVKRAFIGMTIMLVDSVMSSRELAPLLPPNMPEYVTGLLVTYTMPTKPAEEAGLREGDVILEINGRKMTHKGDYFAALGPIYQPGKTLECLVYRPPQARQTRRRGMFAAGEKSAAADSGGTGTVFRATITPTPRDPMHEGFEGPVRRRSRRIP